MRSAHVTTFSFQSSAHLCGTKPKIPLPWTACLKRRIAVPMTKWRSGDDYAGAGWDKSVARSVGGESGVPSGSGVVTNEVDVRTVNGQGTTGTSGVSVDLHQMGVTTQGLQQGVDKTSPGWEPDQQQAPPPNSDVVLGRILLLVVAALWGTYSPALKYLYSLPGSPSPAVLTAIRASIGAAVLMAGSKLSSSKAVDREDDQPGSRVGNPRESNWWSTSGVTAPRGSLQSLLTWCSGSLIISGAELGMWNFLASSSQAVGLEFTTATRAAFLIQSTTLFTPIIATLAGDRLSLTGWIGCAIGLAGSLLITFEAKSGVMAQGVSTSATGMGDVLVLWAALMYALNTVRLGTLAREFKPLDLATSKTVVLAVTAILWALWDCGGVILDGQPIVTLWPGYGDWRAWLVLIWTALGPGALAAFLQTLAQNSVRPAQAQVFIASTPFWSALIAGSFLAGEAMGPWGWVGGIIIVCGGVLSTIDFQRTRTKGKLK